VKNSQISLHGVIAFRMKLSIAPYFSKLKPEDCKDVATIHAQFKLSSDVSAKAKLPFIILFAISTRTDIVYLYEDVFRNSVP